MAAMNDEVNGNHHPTLDLDVIIVGAGFGGVYGLYKVRQLGLSVKVLEAGSSYGGVWHWNRFLVADFNTSDPGARVDSETPFYQLSIPELWKTWNWTERFPGHDELRRYFSHADKVLSLSKDTLFNTIVVEAKSTGSSWILKTEDGRVYTCKYLILATGSSYKKHYPDFKNMEDYQGFLVHSAIYPEDGVDVKGKRVAVIGNGATGVQIVQELAKEDCELTAYIRTPNTALKMVQRPISVGEQEAMKSFYTDYFNLAKSTRSGFPYNKTTKSIWDVSAEEREAQFEELWNRGGFAWLLSNYRDFIIDKKANAIFYEFWSRKVRERIKDPIKQQLVAPIPQQNWFGTKRPSLEQDYYECLDRPNVHLVDFNKTPISSFTKEGILTTDEVERKYDIVILATGYDSLTGSLMDIGLIDKNGKRLQAKWQDGVYTHLGLTIDGMPNMFMVYSPQAPTSLNNGPPIIEIQIDWIVTAINQMREEGLDAIDATYEAADKWRSDIQEMNSHTLYPLTNSWYMGANIPGKIREQLVYLAGQDAYKKTIFDALEGWKGFEVIKASA